MDWLEVRIDTAHQGLEAVEAVLSALGVDGVAVEDEAEFREFLEENRQRWDYVDEGLEREMAGKSRITFYLRPNEAGFAKLGEVRIAMQRLKESHPECAPLLVTLESLRDADWENNWKQYYKPMEVGERLVVIPSWEAAEPGGRVPLILDPGLTFGTGSHATTRMCLELLEETVQGGERVLDLGCGSGILSIAALKLGAASALAADIDDKCPDVACANAALNGIGPDAYTVLTGDILADGALRERIGGGYGVVLANIVADVIIALAPRVRGLLAEGGAFLCSGIIDSRAEEAASALRAAGLEVVETRRDDGWFAYMCKIQGGG